MKCKLKEGKYWLGDVCYVYPTTEWQDFCNNLFQREGGSKCVDGIEMDYKSIPFIVIGTAYGDGIYSLTQKGVEIASLGVDAGLLSVIPLSLVESWKDSKGEWGNNHTDLLELGHIIELTTEVSFVAHGGNFCFGDFEVITADIEEDEEEDDWGEDEDWNNDESEDI